MTLTAPEGEQRCEETAPQRPDDGSGMSVGTWDTSLGGDEHSPTDDGGARLYRPEVDSNRELAADDVENGDDSPSDATLGEGTSVILRRSLSGFVVESLYWLIRWISGQSGRENLIF